MIHDTEINYYLYLPESLHQEADRFIHYLKHSRLKRVVAPSAATSRFSGTTRPASETKPSKTIDAITVMRDSIVCMEIYPHALVAPTLLGKGLTDTTFVPNFGAVPAHNQ